MISFENIIKKNNQALVNIGLTNNSDIKWHPTIEEHENTLCVPKIVNER